MGWLCSFSGAKRFVAFESLVVKILVHGSLADKFAPCYPRYKINISTPRFERVKYLAAARNILDDWPNTFIEVITKAKISRYHFSGLFETMPSPMRDLLSISVIEEACSGISRDMVRVVLRGMKAEGVIIPTCRGRAAKWTQTGLQSTPARNNTSNGNWPEGPSQKP